MCTNKPCHGIVALLTFNVPQWHGLRLLLISFDRVQEQLQQEEAKFRRWHDENVRRKTNYVPFIFNFLTLLAERGQLQGLINRTKKLAAEKKQ